MNTTCIEYAPFRKNPALSESELIAKSDALDQELRKVKGFQGRLLVRQDQATYIDIVFWRSRQDADDAIVSLGSSQACLNYFACMVGKDGKPLQHNTLGMDLLHFAPVKAYGMDKIF